MGKEGGRAAARCLRRAERKGRNCLARGRRRPGSERILRRPAAAGERKGWKGWRKEEISASRPGKSRAESRARRADPAAEVIASGGGGGGGWGSGKMKEMLAPRGGKFWIWGQI